MKLESSEIFGIVGIIVGIASLVLSNVSIHDTLNLVSVITFIVSGILIILSVVFVVKSNNSVNNQLINIFPDVKHINDKVKAIQSEIIEYHNYETYSKHITVKLNRMTVSLDDNIMKGVCNFKHEIKIKNELGDDYNYKYSYHSQILPSLDSEHYHITINGVGRSIEEISHSEKRKYTVNGFPKMDGSGVVTIDENEICSNERSIILPLNCKNNYIKIDEISTPSFSNLQSFQNHSISNPEYISSAIYYPTDYIEVVIKLDTTKLKGYSLFLPADSYDVLDISEIRISNHISDLKTWGAIPSIENTNAESIISWKVNCPIVGYRYKLNFALKKIDVQ